MREAVALLLALVAAYGVFLVYTALALGWSGLGVSPAAPPIRRRSWTARVGDALAQAGLPPDRAGELAAVAAALFGLGAGLGWAVWGGWAPPAVVGLAAASIPAGTARRRRAARRERAREAWPRMIEEIRLQATSLGRSLPQALLAVGARGPEELRGAFAAAHREWLISTDFARTLDVLKARLADPTADAVCETLLVAHEVGGSDVDRRLRALAADRHEDLQGRKDARSKQAGARFARWFVLAVPAGMGAVGLTIGNGRAAYRTPVGQAAVVVALGLMVVCWIWSGLLMRLPEQQRVFTEGPPDDPGDTP